MHTCVGAYVCVLVCVGGAVGESGMKSEYQTQKYLSLSSLSTQQAKCNPEHILPQMNEQRKEAHMFVRDGNESHECTGRWWCVTLFSLGHSLS